MRPLRTTLTSILAIAFAFALIFGMSNEIFAQGYRKGSATCIARDDAPDDDGDGIPNGLDDDYVPPKDGTGKKYGRSRTNRSMANTAGNQSLRGSFRFASLGCIRIGNIKLQSVTPTIGFSRNLRRNSQRAFTGICDGTGRQMRLRKR